MSGTCLTPGRWWPTHPGTGCTWSMTCSACTPSGAGQRWPPASGPPPPPSPSCATRWSCLSRSGPTRGSGTITTLTWRPSPSHPRRVSLLKELLGTLIQHLGEKLFTFFLKPGVWEINWRKVQYKRLGVSGEKLLMLR